MGSENEVDHLSALGDTVGKPARPLPHVLHQFRPCGLRSRLSRRHGPRPIDIRRAGPPGTLYFLFGDSVPDGHPPGSVPTVPPDVALGLTDRTAPPDSATFSAFSSPSRLQKPSRIQRCIGRPAGSFIVPTGGVFVNNTLYAFFWTDHCASAEPLAPNITAPLSLPPANAACQEVALSNLVGRSVLAAATPEIRSTSTAQCRVRFRHFHHRTCCGSPCPAVLSM